MSLNTLLRFVGFGQQRAETGRGGRRRSPSAGPSILPNYTRIAASNLDGVDERRNGSSSPIELSTSPRSPDPSKSNTTTEVHEIDFQDLALTGMDYAYSTGETHSEHSSRTGRSRTRRTEGSGTHDGECFNHGSEINTSMRLPAPTTSAVPLRPFLANFTIGFADGLTVPFALTAGLSWLGSSHMVITAGFAEICAGCVSMGIGGYLAADGERKAGAREAAKNATLEFTASEGRASTSSLSNSPSTARDTEVSNGARADDDWADLDLLRRYLEPLNLPPHLAAAIYDHATAAGGGTFTQKLLSAASTLAGKNCHDGPEEVNSVKKGLSSPAATVSNTMSPVVCGLSVSAGYLAGGLLPLFPYFFVDQVQKGLIWSFIICVVALFVFGATKEFVMFVDEISDDQEDLEDYYSPAWENATRPPGAMCSSLREWMSHARRVSREDVKSSLWDGLRMAWLGSIAALVAVVCVMLSQLVSAEPSNAGEAEVELIEAILASYGNETFPATA